MSQLLAQFTDDHKRLKRLLFVLRAQLDRFEKDAGPDYNRLLQVLEYVADYGEQWHHPAEERAFALLDPDRLSPREAAALERVSAQHRELPLLARSVTDDVEAVLQGMVMPRSKLEEDVTRYLEEQVEHLALEDDVLFPALDAQLDDAQWQALDQAMAMPGDPMFDARDSSRFDRLYYDILEAEHDPGEG